MKTLSTRELQMNIGKLTSEDSPIFITKYKKELFVLLSFEDYEELLEKSKYDGLKWFTKFSMLYDWMKGKNQNPDAVLEMETEYAEAYDGTPPKPSESPAMKDALAQMKRIKEEK